MYHPTSNPNLVVDITIKELKEDKIKAIGIGINPADDTKYTGLGPVPSKTVNKKRKQYAVNEVKTKIEDMYREHYGLGPADQMAMQAAFEQVKRAVFEEGLRLKPSWKHLSTNKAAITFFGKNTLPLLLPFANPESRTFLASDLQEMKNKLDSLANHRRRNKDSNNDSSSDAADRLQEADIIYALMRDKDARLPDLHLSLDAPSIHAPKKEQIKALSRKHLMNFFTWLPDLIKQYPREVFFAVFVIFGLRPAEAAAMKPSGIVWHDSFCTAEVKSQERGGKLEPYLKNEYSRRRVIIPYWGKCLLEFCCNELRDDFPKDDRTMNDAVACSRWVKERLIESGCTEDILEAAGTTIEENDLDAENTKRKVSEDSQKQKIVCYVLRRVFATNCRSIMGLTSYETDRLMGHIPIGAGGKKENRQSHPDLNAYDTQLAIATKMERYIYDPRYSLNPAVTPYTVSEKNRIDVTEFSEVIIENDTDHNITLDLTIDGTEMGETMTIEMPLDSKQKLTHTSISKSWDGYNRTVIGDTTIPKG